MWLSKIVAASLHAHYIPPFVVGVVQLQLFFLSPLEALTCLRTERPEALTSATVSSFVFHQPVGLLQLLDRVLEGGLGVLECMP